MSSLSKPREDYVALGKSVGLELIGSPPQSVKMQTTWKCVHCGREHYKSFRALKMRPNGCACQNRLTHHISDYKAVAERLGIEWVGKNQPRNSKEPTLWRNPRTGAVVEAAYKELAYEFIRTDLRKTLEIDEAYSL